MFRLSGGFARNRSSGMLFGRCSQAKKGMAAAGNLRYHSYSPLGGIPVPWRNRYGFESTLNTQPSI